MLTLERRDEIPYSALSAVLSSSSEWNGLPQGVEWLWKRQGLFGALPFASL
jgi:hypothetical protein